MNDGGRWLLGNHRQAIAIRRRNGGHCRDVIQPVVGVALGAAVEVLLLGQPIPGIPREPIAFAILVDQRLQPPIAVIAELHLSSMGVGALAYLTATVVLVERGVAGGVGIAHQLTAGITLVLLGAPVRQLAAEQASLSVVAELSAFADGVGDDLQIAALVVAKARGVA